MTLRAEYHSAVWEALVVLGWHTVAVHGRIAVMYHTKGDK
jgi:hypothetical protein